MAIQPSRGRGERRALLPDAVAVVEDRRAQGKDCVRASHAPVHPAALGFLVEGVRLALSPDFQERCREMLGSAPACQQCGSRKHRRGMRTLVPLSLQRGYWVCRCSKGGVHLLDRTLGIVRWRCTASPDSTGVPMVRRDAGTADDGKPTKTREAKVAAFHTADRRDPKTGLPERDAGSARYTAAIDSAGRRTPPQRRSCTTRRNTARPSRTCVSPRSSYET